MQASSASVTTRIRSYAVNPNVTLVDTFAMEGNGGGAKVQALAEVRKKQTKDKGGNEQTRALCLMLLVVLLNDQGKLLEGAQVSTVPSPWPVTSPLDGLILALNVEMANSELRRQVQTVVDTGECTNSPSEWLHCAPHLLLAHLAGVRS